jgi:ABC-type multidrug transport system fused ATPase/permease subunit
MSSAGDCFAISFIVDVAGTLVSTRRTMNLVATVIGFVGLIQVAQSRQLTLAAAVTLLVLLLLLRPVWARIVGLMTILAFLGAMSIRGPVVLSQLLDALLPNISEFFGSNLSDNPCINTLAIIMNSLAENYFLGLGAVSLLYEGGWRGFMDAISSLMTSVLWEKRSAWRYSAIFVCTYAAMALRSWQLVGRMEHRILILGVYIIYILLAPTNGLFYRLGFVHAFLYLLMTAAAPHRKSSSAYLTSPQPAASVRRP